MDRNTFRSPLHKMVLTTGTEFWNDSCAVEELNFAIENGAVGATANPVILGEVLKKEFSDWADRISEIITEMPAATEDEITWCIAEEISVKAAKLLEPIFIRENGKTGRLSIQTDPRYYRDAKRMIQQALHFNGLAPNIIVKIPVTAAGVAAIEEATFQGISINATVCFTVPQALAVGEAVEKGLERRCKEGEDVSRMGPVCTIMVGRLDDWLKVIAHQDDIITDPANMEWAGVAVMKKAYKIYKERGYKTRLLSAATRNQMHWSEIMGGDVAVSLTHQWQKRFNGSDIEVKPRMEIPVNTKIIEELILKFEDFRRAYDENGLSLEEFDTYGATRRTLRFFITGYHNLVKDIRDFMIADPDIRVIK